MYMTINDALKVYDNNAHEIGGNAMITLLGLPSDIENMSSIECYEEALKGSKIKSVEDVNDKFKVSKVDRSLFAYGLIKAMNENEDGRYLFHRGYLNRDVESIAKYLCVFSKRAYIGAGRIDFGSLDTGRPVYHESGAENDRVLKLYVAFRDLFINKIAFFAPTSGYIDQFAFSSDPYDFITPLLNQDYKRVNSGDFHRVTEDMVNKLYIGLPWLKNARVEDYVEIVDKYNDRFLRYSYEVRKIADATDDIEKFQRDLIKNVQETIVDLRIALEKKKSELKTKGIITTIGVCFTTMSFLIPDAYSAINPEWLSALLGGGALYEFFDGAKDINEMINVCKENTFFPIWEWNRVTEKRQTAKRWVYKD